VSVDFDKFLNMKLQGAARRKNYKTESRKFKDRDFSRAYALGERVFYEEGSCYACHRDHGEGVTRMYPPLADSEWVSGDKDRLIKLTLHGIWGKLRVRGEIFEPRGGVPPMTAIGNFFSDAEVAGVLTYVRNSWGNDGSRILPEDVKRVREQTRNRLKFYSPEELTEMHPFPEGSRAPLLASPVDTQLEKELQAEAPADLAKAAMMQGDAARGASLFYARKTACATCHDSQEEYQIGPKLTLNRSQTTPEFIVQSILKPSDAILEGFRSVNVVTDEGKVLSGFLVKQTDEILIISIATDKGKLREIPTETVDDVIPLELSTMPTGLAGLCENRQGFLDLARFVIEINQGGEDRLQQLKKKAKIR